MVKKKVSGQTITIIVLGILLLLTIGFGGVYAYYSFRSNRITGRIVMANLNIQFQENGGASGASEMVLSNGVNVVPNEFLQNTPLIINNNSNTPIYIAVLYKLNVYKLDTEELVNYDNSVPLIKGASNDWYDYTYVQEANGTQNVYRCLITLNPQPDEYKEITVIAENQLRLHESVGDEFQETSINFLFQAYAISSESLDEWIDENTSNNDKCKIIMDAISESYDYDLRFTTT